MAETRKLGRPSFSPTRKEAFRKDSNMSKKMFRDKKRKERDEALSTVVPPTAPRYKHIRISTATFWRWRSLAQELGLDGDEQMASFLLNTYYERAVEAASKEQRQDIPQNSEESRQKVETSMFQGDAEGTETDAMGSTCTTMPIQATQDGSIGLHLTEHPPDSMKEQSEDGGEMLEGEFTCLVKTEPHESGEESNEHGTLPSFSQQGDGLTGDDDDDRNEIEEVEFKCLIKEEPDDGERNQPSCSKQGGNSSEQRNNEEMSGDASCDRSHAYGLSSAYSASLSDHGELAEDTTTQNVYDETREEASSGKVYSIFSPRSYQHDPPQDPGIDKPYVCPVCSKGFTRSDCFRRHKKTHRSERPHECHLCPKRFQRAEDLRRHLRTHSGEKPYACSVCNRRFGRNSSLKQHMARYEVSCDTGQRVIKCIMEKVLV
nr:zinc finger and SCAN domain-containing protein 2-like isoform X2 [Lytechinus pictus]